MILDTYVSGLGEMLRLDSFFYFFFFFLPLLLLVVVLLLLLLLLFLLNAIEFSLYDNSPYNLTLHERKNTKHIKIKYTHFQNTHTYATYILQTI